jgi:hypothetical protein
MKSKGIAYILWLIGIFGCLGFHRFYIGKAGTGIIWLLTGGVLGVGATIDLFTLGGQVEQYNTGRELKTLRTTSMANQTAIASQLSGQHAELVSSSRQIAKHFKK